MLCLRTNLVRLLGHYTLKYSQRDFLHRDTTSNLGILFYVSPRLSLFYRIGPSLFNIFKVFCPQQRRNKMRKLCKYSFAVKFDAFFLLKFQQKWCQNLFYQSREDRFSSVQLEHFLLYPIDPLMRSAPKNLDDFCALEILSLQ